MKRLSRVVLGAMVLAAAGCQAADWPQTNIGLNEPPPGNLRVFQWDRVPGASAYQVVVYLDFAGTTSIGTTGFTADTRMPLHSVAWRETHPIIGRPYFWVVRAFDRPDPTGLLLTTRGPREIVFGASDIPLVIPPIPGAPAAP